jgi:hypothetical protein
MMGKNRSGEKKKRGKRGGGGSRSDLPRAWGVPSSAEDNATLPDMSTPPITPAAEPM